MGRPKATRTWILLHTANPMPVHVCTHALALPEQQTVPPLCPDVLLVSYLLCINSVQLPIVSRDFVEFCNFPLWHAHNCVHVSHGNYMTYSRSISKIQSSSEWPIFITTCVFWFLNHYPYDGYKLNSLLTCFQRGFIAQLVEHCPGIIDVLDWISLKPVYLFFWAFFATALVAS